jgi:hypothetical protein
VVNRVIVEIPTIKCNVVLFCITCHLFVLETTREYEVTAWFYVRDCYEVIVNVTNSQYVLSPLKYGISGCVRSED